MTTATAEASASGLPAVATKHSGFPEQIIDGETGYLANEGDPEDIAEKILLYIEHPEGWAEMSRKARAHILATYDQKVLIEEQVHWYQRIADLSKNEQH